MNFDSLSTRDVADIALQRTRSLFRIHGIGSLSYRAWNRGNEGPLLLESKLRRSSILRTAWEDAQSEWRTLRPFLNPLPNSEVCDIGCGHALISLAAALDRPDLRITLVDIERTETKHHDFNSAGAGYASLESATNLLTSNGVPSDQIATFNPEKQQLPQGERFNLVISIISAGFHYPVDDYAQYALCTLKPGGAFIFDMRSTMDQRSALSGFSEIRQIEGGPKSTRLVCFR